MTCRFILTKMFEDFNRANSKTTRFFYLREIDAPFARNVKYARSETAREMRNDVEKSKKIAKCRDQHFINIDGNVG